MKPARIVQSTFLFFFTCILIRCNSSEATAERKLFRKLPSENSGVSFVNKIEESPEINILDYEYTYNGGGVAAADFNNDGLCDLYFSGNAVGNKLYLNNGNLKFEDVTTTAGVSGREVWKTGVAVADVNADGWLDIYLCYSGPELKQSLSNELFINNGLDSNGKLSFSEKAKAYRIDAPGTYSTQSAFFDYDRDGDLDMFLINHGNHFYSPFINTNKLRNMRHPEFGNRLYRNEIKSDSVAGNYFTEVSALAGIHGGGINFGLGVSISDVNDDDWPDIFVTNDYEEQDFLYINNKNGTFTDMTKKSFGHVSRNGMGTDIADFNNDLRPDLMEVDMWPEDNYRQKLLKGPDDFNRYGLMIDSGFHHQQMRNTLQMNAGLDKDNNPIFSEIGQLAGVSATDWSWAPLFVDVNNDGLKDLFVTNGYLRDFTSMDFLKYTVEDARAKARQQGKELNLYELVSKMASTKTSDYIFKNNGDLSFSDVTEQWGINTPNLSFGATYADLDNDGDVELITNNTNEEATIWINQTQEASGHRYLSINLRGPHLNPFGIGSKVYVETDSSVQMQELYLTRGFQSSVEPVLHFGMGKSNLKNVRVVWGDGRESLVEKPGENKLLTISYDSSKDRVAPTPKNSSALFEDITGLANINFIHKENEFNDFDREPLLPYQFSRTGPALACADVNGDGRDDFYVGGAAGQPGELFIQHVDGKFSNRPNPVFAKDAGFEDTAAVFLDADRYSDLDLFVVSGGNENLNGSAMLDDRLYTNDGHGNFSKSSEGMIADHSNGTCVAAADFDKDGDVDLYVGGGVIPGSFPSCSPGALLRNDSDIKNRKPRFTVITKQVNLDLRQPGIVSHALWSDYNHDTWPDLLITGHFMPTRIFQNREGELIEVKTTDVASHSGLWNTITPIDFDNDGDLDYAVGNAGNNIPWSIAPETPLTIYASDFDSDSRVDPVITYTSDNKQYPVASRDEMLSQINSLRKKFVTYSEYGKATVNDLFTSEKLTASVKYSVNNTSSSLLENLGNGEFRLRPLPALAQISATQGFIAKDFDGDGNNDLLAAGNFYSYRTQYGASDSSLGLLLLGDGKGNFNPVTSEHTNFIASGDIRKLGYLRGGKNGKEYILLIRNNDAVSLYKINNESKPL
jgi:enediyne biosynthesis protein E4